MFPIVHQLISLSKPAKIIAGIYVTYMVIYVSAKTYVDSKKYLQHYRAHTLKELGVSTHHIEKIKSEWDAVTAGANARFWEHVWDSIFWPVTSVRSIIPAIVLSLNPPGPKIP